MSLPDPVGRKLLHSRHIECRGFLRDDGLLDVDAHLTDVKDHPWLLLAKGELPAGEALHDMWLRVTVDETAVVQNVLVSVDASPFPLCPTIAPAFAKLIGVRLGPGWRKEVKERLGGIQGCTHLVELLATIATVAFQSLAPLMESRWPKDVQPAHFDSCHVLRTDGETVKAYYPQWYKAPKPVAE